VNNTFITRCKFGFPRSETENGIINSVDVSLKSRSKVYHLPRSSEEVRINDYHPLLLLLWKANIDIQYVADSSLVIAHYVTGYVTKAETSHMQEDFAEISVNKSLYSRLWSFGVRSLRYHECGLYEAADILLGNHLCSKSDTVEWISAEHPNKRKRRVKGYNALQNLAEVMPDSCDLYESGLVDTFYPQRPGELEDCCLYNFKKWYKPNGYDANGKKCTVDLINLFFQTIEFMIHTRKIREIITILSYFSNHFAMSLTWSKMVRVLKMLLIISWTPVVR